MKNYLKPYTMCTRVECEGHFLKCTKYPPCPTHQPLVEAMTDLHQAHQVVVQAVPHQEQRIHLLRASSLRAKNKDHGNQITKLKT